MTITPGRSFAAEDPIAWGARPGPLWLNDRPTGGDTLPECPGRLGRRPLLSRTYSFVAYYTIQLGPFPSMGVAEALRSPCATDLRYVTTPPEQLSGQATVS